MQFEVIGSVTGEHKNKIYLFYDDDFGHKDSLRSDIINGKFHFKETVKLPVLCRFHFGEKTNIQELYIDSKNTCIKFSSVLTEKNTPESLGGPRETFKVESIIGSNTQDQILSMGKWSDQLEKSNQSKGKKSSEYYAKLLSINK